MGDLQICGFIEPGLSRVESFKAQVHDLLNDHGVVFGFEESVDIFESVGVHLIVLIS